LVSMAIFYLEKTKANESMTYAKPGKSPLILTNLR